MTKAVILGFTLALLTSTADAANMKWSPAFRQLKVSGEIREGDAEQLTWRLRSAPVTDGKKLVQLYLNSRGGDLPEALKMSFVLTNARLHGWTVYTAVGPGAECNSACVVVFAVGEVKWIVEDGSVSVHRVHEGHYDKRGRLIDDGRNADSIASQRRVADILKGQGAPDSVIQKLLDDDTTTGTQLTHEELQAWGAIFLN